MEYGGQLTNGLWGIYDGARVGLVASQSITNPLSYLISQADDWEEAGDVAAFYVALELFLLVGRHCSQPSEMPRWQFPLA